MSERRLAAIMFTDVVGFTQLSQTNESVALQLLHEHKDLLRPLIVAHGGIEVKTMGDAFLVEFRSALDAVTCAVGMQKMMAERNAQMAPSRKLDVRIGIHVGDVVHESGDIYGDAVNVASRIEPLAERGGICISQQVFDQIRNKTPLSIEKLGDVKLKNVELPVAVYKINPNRNQTPIEERPNDRERLGVLPFVNISPDPNDEYFADGLTEELISKLSEIKNLKVIARTSVMSYKRKDKKVSEIARELGVGSVIEGSVRKAGNKVRITVQLIDPHTEEHLWSSNYDGQLDDIFAIQSDVASKVASSLSTGFFSTRKDTDNIEAYTLYLRAVQLSYDLTEPALREVVSLLKRAITLDPEFARAYAALTDAYTQLAVMGYEEFAVMVKKAESAALTALKLDPKLAEAHASMSHVHSSLDRFDEALAEAQAAIRINPNLSYAYTALGILYTNGRDPEEALPMFKKAYELDPLSPGSAEMFASAAQWTGDGKLAREVLERLMEFSPKNAKVYLSSADYYMETKEYDEAQRLIDAARAISPEEPIVAVSQGLLYAMRGERKEAEKLLRELQANENESVRLNAELTIYAALGDLDNAFETLMKQAEIHSWPFAIKWDPLYADMRKDPRFNEFCIKVGIEPLTSSGTTTS